MFIRWIKILTGAAGCLALLSGCASLVESMRPTPNAQAYRAHKAKVLEEIGTFDFDRRAHQLAAIDDLARRCHRLPLPRPFVVGSTETFDDAPVLSLYDRDGDRLADMYAYGETIGAPTPHFGYIFDLNEDGRADWITFNQGTMIAKPLKILWTSYHSIDTNYDGRADVFVKPDTDLDQDGMVEEGVFTWFQDSDFDGRVDHAEYLGAGVEEAIDCTDDVIAIKCVSYKEIDIGKKDFFDFETAMLSDINQLLE
jgi:hypothetical protein